jgi:hypothetical protein
MGDFMSERACDCREYEIIYWYNPETKRKEVSHGICKRCLKGVVM